MGRRKPRILFLDAYDSFSHNIVSLLETLDVEVYSLKIDDSTIDSISKLKREIKAYDAIVCGPGPGHPKNKHDVGAIASVWKLPDEDLVPVLGICLGFQSLCLAYGADVKRLKGPQHGIVRRINHIGEFAQEGDTSIFCGVGKVEATLYQSLCADIGQDDIPDSLWDLKKWQPTKQCPELLPLAWVESELADVDCSSSGIADKRVFVGVRHCVKPFWALQYHPESICTNSESKKVIANWVLDVLKWNGHCARKIVSSRPSTLRSTPVSLLKQNLLREEVTNEEETMPGFKTVCYTTRVTITRELVDIVELLQDMSHDHVILESSNNQAHSAAVRGRYSIIGLNQTKCVRYEYTIGDTVVQAIQPHDPGTTPKICNVPIHQPGGIWATLTGALQEYQDVEGYSDSPFWGGLIGFTTYELGLEGIGVGLHSRPRDRPSRPDACFVMITESIVVDHEEGTLYFQKLGPKCMKEKIKAEQAVMAQKLQKHIIRQKDGYSKETRIKKQMPVGRLVSYPSNEEYEGKVRKCQEFIRSGNSYELCLTDQSTVECQQRFGERNSWLLYKKLRRSQPAPFASYLNLGSATLVSASPERFLKWDKDGKCELRPMKGTIRKTPHTTFKQAKALLDVPKERAENLMIVDLVRHDLHGICGSGNVTVPKLMVVEEYESVYQMISIVQGQIPPPLSLKPGLFLHNNEAQNMHARCFTGIDVLAASLPPGSMTGAPKKRSCEILQQIEKGKERSLYSGVVGYMDVGGRGDFSVTIRCMFKWDDEDCDKEDENGTVRKIEKWYVGAGGAVTTLSTPEGEREEMFTKARGTLGVF